MRTLLYDEVEGNGVGMAIVRRIVEAHGGTIEVADCSFGAEIHFTHPAPVTFSAQS